jgi:hypothetical protein
VGVRAKDEGRGRRGREDELFCSLRSSTCSSIESGAVLRMTASDLVFANEICCIYQRRHRLKLA